MGWITIAALFFVIWWVTLFAALPIALHKSRREESSAAGAGLASKGGRRGLAVVLLTTLIAGVIVGALAVAVNVYGLSMDIFPQVIPD
jgi:predicted secreted protein